MSLFRRAKRPGPVQGRRPDKAKTTPDATALPVAPAAAEGPDLRANAPNLLDLLTPDIVDRSSPRHVKIGQYYAQTHQIIGWPRYLQFGWFNAWLQLPYDVDVAIHVEPYEGRVARDALGRQQVRLTQRLRAEIESGELKERELLQQALEEIQSLRHGIQGGHTNLYAVSLLATLYARQPEMLEGAMEQLIKDIERAGFFGRIAEALHDLGALATMPQGILPDRLARRRNLDADALATLFPFVAADLVHPEGVYFGINLATGAPLLYDQFDRSLANHNVLIYAESGAGKSTQVKTALIGRPLLLGRSVVVLDPEGEYRTMARELGGTFIELGRSDAVINPFDVSPEVDEATGQQRVDLESKILDIVGLIEAMAAGMELTPVQKGHLEHLVGELYARFGITEDPASLTRPATVEDGLVVSPDGRVRKPMPTLSDLYELMQERMAEDEHLSAVLRPVADIVGRYRRDHPSARWLDGQTTVPIEESDFVVFSLYWLGDRDWSQKALALYVALTWVWERFLKRPRQSHKVCVVDEAWQLADHPRTFAFLERVVRRCRKRDAGLVVIAQDAWRFLGERAGEAIHNNCATWIFLRQGRSNLDVLREKFHLPSGVLQQLGQLERGSGILVCGGRPYLFRNEVTPYEASWAFTSRSA
ncbi:VirB4 family type IV secretion system protein [Thermaerobacter litoralis]